MSGAELHEDAWGVVLGFLSGADFCSAAQTCKPARAAALTVYKRTYAKYESENLIDRTLAKRTRSAVDPLALPRVVLEGVFRGPALAKRAKLDARFCLDTREKIASDANKRLLTNEVKYFLRCEREEESGGGGVFTPHAQLQELASKPGATLALPGGVILESAPRGWARGDVVVWGTPTTLSNKEWEVHAVWSCDTLRFTLQAGQSTRQVLERELLPPPPQHNNNALHVVQRQG